MLSGEQREVQTGRHRAVEVDAIGADADDRLRWHDHSADHRGYGMALATWPRDALPGLREAYATEFWMAVLELG